MSQTRVLTFVIVATLVSLWAQSAFPQERKLASCPELTHNVISDGSLGWGFVDYPNSAHTLHTGNQGRITDIYVQDHRAGNPALSLTSLGYEITEINRKGRIRHVLAVGSDRTSIYMLDCARHTLTVTTMTLDGITLSASGQCHRRAYYCQ